MSAMNERYLPTAARVLLGTVFTLFGLNGFLNFMPTPPAPEAAQAFMGALVSTGYMMAAIKIVELGAGVLLLFGRYVPLALVLLAPGIVNITLFHIFLAPSGLWLAAVVLALELYLAWSYRDVYRPMLSARTVPTARKAESEQFHHDVPVHEHVGAR